MLSSYFFTVSMKNEVHCSALVKQKSKASPYMLSSLQTRVAIVNCVLNSIVHDAAYGARIINLRTCSVVNCGWLKDTMNVMFSPLL